MGEDLVNHDFLYYLSAIFGWIYFVAWSVSFYGIKYENFRRQSVSGLSFDFLLYNLVGYAGYSIYTIMGYKDKCLGTGEVSIQDIIFALHALLLTITTIIQTIYYYNREDPLQYVSYTCIGIVIALVWGVLQIFFMERILNLYDPHITPGSITMFNSVIYLGWCKVFISSIKFIPQAVSNYNRKSTEGWSILNILLDFTGGIFSFAQNLVDTLRNKFTVTPQGQPASLNLAKFALSFVSIFFDVIFIVQHYCLYKKTEYERKYEMLTNDA